MTKDDIPPDATGLAGDEPRSLDEQEIVRNFLGRTHKDFSRMLRERKGFTTEDFMWMGEPGLRYYLPAVDDYLRSEESAGDWELAYGMVTSLCFQLKEGIVDPEVKRLARSVAARIGEHVEKFGIAPEDSALKRQLRSILE